MSEPLRALIDNVFWGIGVGSTAYWALHWWHRGAGKPDKTVYTPREYGTPMRWTNEWEFLPSPARPSAEAERTEPDTPEPAVRPGRYVQSRNGNIHTCSIRDSSDRHYLWWARIFPNGSWAMYDARGAIMATALVPVQPVAPGDTMVLSAAVVHQGSPEIPIFEFTFPAGFYPPESPVPISEFMPDVEAAINEAGAAVTEWRTAEGVARFIGDSGTLATEAEGIIGFDEGTPVPVVFGELPTTARYRVTTGGEAVRLDTPAPVQPRVPLKLKNRTLDLD